MASPRLATVAPALRLLGPRGSGVEVLAEVVTAIKIDRVRDEVTVDCVVSDVEPFAGALDAGLWERDHTAKTIEAIHAILAQRVALHVWACSTHITTADGNLTWYLRGIDARRSLSGTRITLRFSAGDEDDEVRP